MSAHQKSEKRVNHIAELELFFKAVISAYPDIRREEIKAIASSYGIPDAEGFADVLLFRDTRTFEISEKERIRKLSGEVLARLFFDPACSPLLIAERADGWHLWDELATAFCSFLEEVDASIVEFKQRYRLLIAEWQEDIARKLRMSAEEAEAYKNYWANETDVSEVWREDPFQDFIHKALPAFSALKCLLPHYIKDLLDILADVKLPDVLSDTLWALGCVNDLPEMLTLAPTTLDSREEGGAKWNKSLLAPAILRTASDYTASWLDKDESQKAADLWRTLVDILGKRDDGSFLAQAFLKNKIVRLGFVQEIKTPESKNNWIICNELAKIVLLPDNPDPKMGFETIFGYPLDKAIRANTSYIQTGINAPHERGMTLFSLLAYILPENRKLAPDTAIVFFKLLLAYEKAGLHTSGHFQFPDFRHKMIGRLYAASEDPEASMHDTFEHLSGAWSRLRQSLFCENSLELRNTLNFVFASAIYAIHYLNGIDPEKSEALRNLIKKELFTYNCLDWFQEEFLLALLKSLDETERERWLVATP